MEYLVQLFRGSFSEWNSVLLYYFSLRLAEIAAWMLKATEKFVFLLCEGLYDPPFKPFKIREKTTTLQIKARNNGKNGRKKIIEF